MGGRLGGVRHLAMRTGCGIRVLTVEIPDGWSDHGDGPRLSGADPVRICAGSRQVNSKPICNSISSEVGKRADWRIPVNSAEWTKLVRLATVWQDVMP